jgi:transcriptional regulator with XRE-family HTH domain
MDAHELSDTKLAGRIGVARETIYRWRTEQHRLDPGKMGAIADALGIEPDDLWYPPTKRTNLNALAQNLDDHDFETVEITIKRLAKRQ